jgi:transposase InsO family protein
MVDLASSSYYHRPKGPTDRQQRLEQRIITWSKKHPHWEYRFVHPLLCGEGWTVNRKRVQRVRRQEGLRVPTVGKRKTALALVDRLSGASRVSGPRLVVGFYYGSDHRRSPREDADEGR